MDDKHISNDVVIIECKYVKYSDLPRNKIYKAFKWVKTASEESILRKYLIIAMWLTLFAETEIHIMSTEKAKSYSFILKYIWDDRLYLAIWQYSLN